MVATCFGSIECLQWRNAKREDMPESKKCWAVLFFLAFALTFPKSSRHHATKEKSESRKDGNDGSLSVGVNLRQKARAKDSYKEVMEAIKIKKAMKKIRDRIRGLSYYTKEHWANHGLVESTSAQFRHTDTVQHETVYIFLLNISARPKWPFYNYYLYSMLTDNHCDISYD